MIITYLFLNLLFLFKVSWLASSLLLSSSIHHFFGSVSLVAIDTLLDTFYYLHSFFSHFHTILIGFNLFFLQLVSSFICDSVIISSIFLESFILITANFFFQYCLILVSLYLKMGISVMLFFFSYDSLPNLLYYGKIFFF